MTREAENPELIMPPTGSSTSAHSGGAPDWRWIVLWVLITTAVIPIALILSPPFGVVGLWIQDLGASAGLWTGGNRNMLAIIGFIVSLALTLPTAQWYLLRNWLPRAKFWFLATSAGVLLGGLIVAIGLTAVPALSWPLAWGQAVLALAAGGGLGLVQWLYLRQIVPRAYWIIFINALATGSLLFSGDAITSWIELLILLLLPGVITGTGLWLLLARSQVVAVRPNQRQVPETQSQRFSWLTRLGLSLASLAALFFACSWVYAASQLALAKIEGIYATPEEAILARNSQGWGGASVIKLEDVRAGPNNHDGSLPHVWFGGATVFLDRVPEGGSRSQYSTGSFYLRVRDGWVYLPEGAFPGFVGWVMELYNLEGVKQ